MHDAAPPFPGPLAVERSPLRTPDDVARMLQLQALGWGAKRIARELGCAKNTVKKYLAQRDWRPALPAARPGMLDPLEEWSRTRFHQHHGNADVVRQDLAREHGITVSLRTVERSVKPLRQALRATTRYETRPGEQLQIDFGERTVVIAGVKERVYVFVATLGYSRRPHVRAFLHARQSAWLDGLESAFHAFGGVPQTVLLDHAKALVLRHVMATREVTFHPRLLAFAQHWGFRPIACAPYRAQTKGKDERGVWYVKHNALAGHTFESFAALEAHLARWTREVADVRVHGTTGEAPIVRFTRDEAAALTPLAARASFQPTREWWRRVQSASPRAPGLWPPRPSPRRRSCGRWRSMRRRSARPCMARPHDDASCHAGGARLAARSPHAARDADTPQAYGHPRSVGHAARRGGATRTHARRDRRVSLRVRDRFKDVRRIDMALGLARFPMVRELSGYDFTAQPGVDKQQIRELAAGRFIANGESVLLLGPPGVGKTHLSVGLGRAAITTGYTVLFTSATTLIAQLVKAHTQGQLDEKLLHFAKPKLLIIDELGYLPIEPDAAHVLFQLVSRRYERGSILLTSNRAVSEWGAVFGDPVVATAILDRLLHHSHVLTIRGESYRLNEKRRAGLLTDPRQHAQTTVTSPQGVNS